MWARIWAWLMNNRLDCGCLAAQVAVYPCPICGMSRCPQHRFKVHNCQDFLRPDHAEVEEIR